MPQTRRSFLRVAAGAAGAVAFAELSRDAAACVANANEYAGDRTAEELATDEDFWFHIERAYEVDRSMINLNNGGVAPAPRVVRDAMRNYLDHTNQAPARTLWTDLDPGVELVRRDLARVFGCDSEEMAITRNASESLEIAIHGLDLKRGDEILMTNQDYPRMINTWKQRALREGVVVRELSFDVPPKRMDDLLRLYEKAITPKTKVIHVCHITNLTGQIFPIREICRVARNRGIPTVVDGAHAFAHFQFKRDDLDCDYYGTSLHKWLSAPIGTGLLYVRRDRIADHWPLMAAPDPKKDDIRKFEEIGTHPAAERLAIGEAVRFYDGIGPARKEARLRYLREYWMRQIDKDDRVRILTSRDPKQSCAIGTFRIEGIDCGKLVEHLWKAWRVFVIGIKHDEFEAIRVTPNVYTTLRELDVYCDALRKVLRDGLPA